MTKRQTITEAVGRSVDTAIGVFFPGWAVNRTMARNLNAIQLRGYDASKTTRFNKNRTVTDYNINSELLQTQSLDKIRKFSRDLCKNSPLARSIQRALSAHIVGSGVTLQAGATDKSGQPLRDFNSAIERRWRLWEKECDIRGMKTLSQFLQQGIYQLVEGGEYLINRSVTESGLRLESVDSDLLDTAYNDDSKNIVGAVTMDALGRPTAYNFLKNGYKVSTINLPGDYKTIPADRISHIFIEQRPGQMRGEPWLAPVLVMLWTAHRAVEAELYSLEVQACLSVVYKSGVGGVGKKWMGQQTSVNDSSSGNNFQRLAPASILQLTNAEDITVVDPKRPGNSFAPFVDKIMEYVSAAMGISYAKSVKDYSKGNFSSQRMGDADDRRHLRQVQNLLIDRFIRPVYNDFVRGEIISGRVAAPGFAKNPELYLQSNFTFEPYDYIQPLDDAKADTERIASGMKSFKDLLSENGKDWDEHFAQVAAERKLSEKLGIEFIYGGKEQKPVEVNGGNNAE